MHVGVPAEVKNREARVSLTPEGAKKLVTGGHRVTVQAGAGAGAGFPDAAYKAAGAVMGTVDDAWGAEMVLKVKEPVPHEFGRLRADLTLFTFLHLAANRALAEALVDSGATAISYDTVQLSDGSLPLLKPMSEVAGRLAVLAGAYQLLGSQGGRGLLLSGMTGVSPVAVTVLGAGVAGTNAIAQAVAMGADVTVLDLSEPRLEAVGAVYDGTVTTVLSTSESVDSAVVGADLVIGAVLVPGRPAPKIVSHDTVARMRPGSVLVDIAIDQGGCFEDSRPTTHDAPVFPVEQAIFYCVTNMPGAVAGTSTQALTNATFDYALALADSGWEDACARDSALAAGLSSAGGKLRHAAAIEAFPELPAG